ncbi:MAG: DUF177 domain-containing protein [Firmicutes bacterium]|nr:DUF177 domain-containing protein [Bacillota bacterium]
MKIDVSELRKVKGRVEEFAGNLPGFTVDFQGAAIAVRGLKVLGKATNTGKEILVQGNVEARAELNCSLCLKPFLFDLKFPFTESFFRVGDAGLKKEEGLGRVYEGDTIDLTEVINEGLILSLPMKPLCKPGCRGLCAACGLDLNLGECNCEKQEGDPRLIVLGELLKKNAKNNQEV